MKKSIIITLFLLSILMIGAVSASENGTDDAVSLEQQELKEKTTFEANTENKILLESEKEINNNKKTSITTKTSVTESSKINNSKSTYEEDTIGETGEIRTFNDLKDEINEEITKKTNKITLNCDYWATGNSEIIINGNLISGNSKTFTIYGNNKTLNARNNCRILTVTNGAQLIIENLKLINGNIEHNGGAIYLQNSKLTLTNCTFANNRANANGGAIHAENDSTLTITNSIFTNNTAKTGGAIFNRALETYTVNIKEYSYGYVAITKCNFTYNVATGQKYGSGGAIYNEGNLNIKESNFTNNTATYDGGAIYITSMYAKARSEITIINSNINNNHASYGGGIYIYSDTFNKVGVGKFYPIQITNCKFLNNTATLNEDSYTEVEGGGAITSISETSNQIILTNCNFTNNTSMGKGGAIYNGACISDKYRWYLTINNCNFTNNTAKQDGGAIYNTDRDYYAVTKVTNSIFINNIANGNGGATYNAAIITNSIFINNIANGNGGATYNEYGGAQYKEYNSTITNSLFIGNSAENGGAIYNDITNYHYADESDNYKVFIEKSKFIENTAIIYGGAIYNSIDYNQYDNYPASNIINTYIIQSIFTNDKVSGTRGSGIYIKTKNNVSIHDSVFNDDNIYSYYNTTNIDLTGTKFLTIPKFEIKVDSDFIDGSAIININVTEKKGLNGTVTVTIGTNAYNILLKNGTGTSGTITPNLSPGTYKAILHFDATNKYSNVTLESDVFTLIPKLVNPELSININNVEEGNIIIINVTAVSTFNDDIKVKITGTTNKIITVTLMEGKGEAFTMLPVGEYTASISFLANNRFTNANTTTNFIVKIKLNSENVNIPSLDNPNSDGTVIVTLPSDATGTVTLNINNQNHEFPVINGISQVKIPENANGIYTITYSGNNKYTSYTKNGFLNKPTNPKEETSNNNNNNPNSDTPSNPIVESKKTTKQTTKIIASKKIFKTKVKTKKYAVILKNNKNKAINKATITLTIKGKKYKKTIKTKTNNKGKAIFKIKKLTKKGKYKAIINYKGDSKYKPSKKTVIIIIK